MQVCLSISPLFVFFAAFNKFRGWFNSWLNITFGYVMSYPFVVLVVSGLMSIFDSLSQLAGTGDYAQAWVNTGMIFVLCLIYAFLMGKVGELASQMFSGGNLAISSSEKGIAKAKGAFMGAGLMATGGVGMLGRGMFKLGKSVIKLGKGK